MTVCLTGGTYFGSISARKARKAGWSTIDTGKPQDTIRSEIREDVMDFYRTLVGP